MAGLEEERLKTLTASLGIPNAFRRWEELVEFDELDIVALLQPNFLHAPIAVAALEGGRMCWAKSRLRAPAPRPRPWSTRRSRPGAS